MAKGSKDRYVSVCQDLRENEDILKICQYHATSIEEQILICTCRNVFANL